MRTPLAWIVGAGITMAVAAGCGENPDNEPDKVDGKADAGGDKDSDAGAHPDASGDSDTQTQLARPTDLPKVTGACPVFAEGELTFAPAALGKTRTAQVWIGKEAATLDGPLVFYWYGTGSSPTEALWGLNEAIVDEIKAMGGLVVAPFHDPDVGTYPWFLVSEEREDDLILADEILACAISEVGVDTRRIHTMGLSAGALHSSQMGLRRSNYIASIVTYSGGLTTSEGQTYLDPSNKFAAMLFHGGEEDFWVLDFQETTRIYRDFLRANGNFSFMCNHETGHVVPHEDVDHAFEFLKAHPFRTEPSPYSGGLPASFPTYCSLN